MRLDGHKLLQVWQWNTQAEQTVAAVVRVCRTAGFTGMVVKALDGATWMGRVDPTPAALRSVDDARRQAEESHAAGLVYAVWTIPRDRDLAEQARLTAALAAAPEIDAVFLDVEPYLPSFWGAWRPAGRARDFMERIRAAAPDAALVLQPDPRPGRLAEIRPDEWLPYTSALAGQHYFHLFETDPAEEMARALALGEQWGLPVYPTLPGEASADDLRTAVHALRGLGGRGCVLFRLGVATAAQLRAVGGVDFDAVGSAPASGLPFRTTEAAALAYVQSRGHTVVPDHAIGRAALTARRLGLPYLDPGPAVEDEHEELLDGGRWMVQRFTNLTIKWSDATGVLLHPVNARDD
ncbi:MAG: hypothetical protein HY689_06670 [Chloroflexi bacterium]|nr:hypothetical protein [Chloroflexota bacterium]